MEGCLFLSLGRPRFGSHAPEDSLQALAAWRRELLEYGPSTAASRTDGDFAVGLREPGGRTFLAVDRFAQQSLCYRIAGDRLEFAARADELVGTQPEIDPQAIFDYLYFHCIPSPRTIFAGVARLPPGHCAVFENGQLTVTRYWTPRFETPSAHSLDALGEEFRHLLEQSVHRQLDGTKPACFLSGGTDSSTIAGLIGKVSGRPAATYSIGFDAAGYDEMAYARIAARHFGTEHHELYLTPDDLVRSIADVACSYDQPFGNSSALPAYYCARFARDDGVSRLLAGDGGDELFGGNSRYALQRIFNLYSDVPSLLRARVIEPILGIRALHKVSLLRRGASYVEQAKMPMPERMQLYNLLRRLGFDEILTAGFLARVDAGEATRQQRGVWQEAEASSELDRTLAYDWRYTLSESDLPKVRGTSQLAGIEVGFPFLDRDVLEFSMRLPPHLKLKGLKLRWFFKHALRDFLPTEIIGKRKQGFGLPFGVWATQHQALKRLAIDALRSLSGRAIVRAEFIDALIDTHLPAHPGYYGEMVWILMILEHWLQCHAPDYNARD
jgi:asparagine synthase (glutamine-hydrolysing)